MPKYEDKVRNIYIQKHFTFDVGSFLNFLHEKVKLDSYSIDLINGKLQQFGVQGQFDEQTFRLLLRIVKAVQTKGEEAKDMNRDQFKPITTQIDFKSKKSNKPQKDSQKQNNEALSSPEIQPQKPSNESIQIKNNEVKVQKIQEQHVHDNRFYETKEMKPSKQANQLSSIEQVDNSTEINLSNPGQGKGPKFLDMAESIEQSHKIAKIIQYQKFSADYVNPVIKYTIVYDNKKVLRRFSEFQKLINILRQNYEGFILPKLPPKEGIKAGINYFWGIDEAFLEERKRKLQDMLNRLLQNNFINEDKLLYRFLTDQYFEIQYNKQGYSSYIKSLTDIVFNAKQLKDFGVAYYNYLREKGNVKLDVDIQNKYSKISQIIEVFTVLDAYRNRINTNFDKRRQFIHELGVKSRNPSDSSLDKLMDSIEEEIQDLNFQFQNYKDLKSQQSWIIQLIRQKEGDGQKTLYELREQQDKLVQRLHKIEKNLRLSLDQFKNKKTQQLHQISGKIIAWRVKVHP